MKSTGQTGKKPLYRHRPDRLAPVATKPDAALRGTVSRSGRPSTHRPPAAVPRGVVRCPAPAIEPDLFGIVRDMVYKKSGISLRTGKEAMVRARLDKRMRELAITSIEKYVDLVRNEKGCGELVHLIDAITTNVTAFFREPSHFVFLRDLLRQWMVEGKRRLRFWSAACASGEEPYSLAMTALECNFGVDVDFRILATDISSKALREAKRGEYDALRMRSVPPHMRSLFFRRIPAVNGDAWSAKETLRGIMDIGSINLASPPYPVYESLDVIFCRNVMIYFDDDLRRSICREMFRLLKPGGCLFIGHAESLVGCSSEGTMIVPSVYRKR
jgi:chemotaxis protein methyltransferase CheR